MISELLKKIPVSLKGDIINRDEPCRFCGNNKGILIAKTDYWDIKETSIVKCMACGISQLDPMLTDEEVSKGCLAYYVEESLRQGLKEHKRNLLRSFRRGVLFGYSLKKWNHKPENILEFGPGTGYFLQGIKFVFPEVKITVADINGELLDFNRHHHGYEIMKMVPEKKVREFENKFDLIIARDLLEHVSDASIAITNINNYLINDGLFHFITPNGHEDVWKHYLTYSVKKQNSELLINHVNYFDGRGLKNHLSEKGFETIEYYTYNFKTTRRGRGWKISEKLMAPVSHKKNADEYIRRTGELINNEIIKEEILNKWFIKRNIPALIWFIIWYHHGKMIKLDPCLNVGHEIYGLFRKYKNLVR